MAVTRRSVLKSGLALGALASAPGMGRHAYAKKKRIVVRDLGIGTSFVDAYGKAFTEQTGIEVVAVTAQHEPAGLIKQMVDAKNFTWDMSIVSRSVASQLENDGDGYLEPLQLENAAAWQSLPETFRSSYYAGNDVVATVLAYRHDRIKTAPRSWADLWNTAAYPGNRALRRFPFDTIEQALLADGVAPQSLYPCDFDRAFASLDKLKKEVGVWWTSGAQTSQLLMAGEVDFCPTWNARAQVAIDAGAPVSIMWEQALWQTEGWVILKGTPNAELCREFIKFALQPERQAIFAEISGYGPTQADAMKFVKEERALALPTHPDNTASAILIDIDFWGENKDRGADLFNNWIVS